MAGRILSLAPVQRRIPAPEPVALGVPQDLPARLHFWRGASGKRYVHTVYSLIECPPLPKAMYLLVHRNKDGQRQVLHIGCGQDEASTLNLARVRQRGAQLLHHDRQLDLAQPEVLGRLRPVRRPPDR